MSKWWEKEIEVRGKPYRAWLEPTGEEDTYAGGVYDKSDEKLADILVEPCLHPDALPGAVFLSISVGGKVLLRSSFAEPEDTQFAVFSWLTGGRGIHAIRKQLRATG